MFPMFSVRKALCALYIHTHLRQLFEIFLYRYLVTSELSTATFISYTSNAFEFKLLSIINFNWFNYNSFDLPYVLFYNGTKVIAMQSLHTTMPRVIWITRREGLIEHIPFHDVLSLSLFLSLPIYLSISVLFQSHTLFDSNKNMNRVWWVPLIYTFTYRTLQLKCYYLPLKEWQKLLHDKFVMKFRWYVSINTNRFFFNFNVFLLLKWHVAKLFSSLFVNIKLAVMSTG